MRCTDLRLVAQRQPCTALPNHSRAHMCALDQHSRLIALYPPPLCRAAPARSEACLLQVVCWPSTPEPGSCPSPFPFQETPTGVTWQAPAVRPVPRPATCTACAYARQLYCLCLRLCLRLCLGLPAVPPVLRPADCTACTYARHLYCLCLCLGLPAVLLVPRPASCSACA